jgi:hypothetical protein
MKLKITFEVVTDIKATDSEICEWVNFNLHFQNQMKKQNPLANIELEAGLLPDIRRDDAFIQ